MMAAVATLSALFLFPFIASGQVESYSENHECQWIGADGRHGPYLPIGACKHIFNPYNLSNPDDDQHYSTKYECQRGVVYSKVWGSDSSCETDDFARFETQHVDGVEGDYFSCKGTQPCPYAIIRFHHQSDPKYGDDISSETECIRSNDGWYSEAPMTVYECLEADGEWYMLSCTADGKGLISTDYTPHCTQMLNQTVFYDGCNYKDLFVEIKHCDYIKGFGPEITSTSTSTSTTPKPVISTTKKVQTSTSTSKNVFLSTIVIDDDGHGHDHGHHRGSSDRSDSSSRDNDNVHRPMHSWESDEDGSSEDEDDGLPLMWFIILGDFALVVFLLCVCFTCKWHKQKREMEKINAIIADECKGDDVQVTDVEGAKSYSVNNVVVVDNKSTVLLDEGDAITFK